jgi:hypothetical protein
MVFTKADFKCMVGIKRNLKQTLEIAETSSDPKTKLEAKRMANDCYRYIMDLYQRWYCIKCFEVYYAETRMDKHFEEARPKDTSIKRDNGRKRADTVLA